MDDYLYQKSGLWQNICKIKNMPCYTHKTNNSIIYFTLTSLIIQLKNCISHFKLSLFQFSFINITFKLTHHTIGIIIFTSFNTFFYQNQRNQSLTYHIYYSKIIPKMQKVKTQNIYLHNQTNHLNSSQSPPQQSIQYNQCFSSQSDSNQTTKGNQRKSIQKTTKWGSTMKRTKNFIIVNTVVICFINSSKQSQIVVQSQATPFKRKKKAIYHDKLEKKAKKLALQHRSSILRQKYSRLKKTKVQQKKIEKMEQRGMGYGIGFEGIKLQNEYIINVQI